jgi:hypothetical protein
MKQDISVYDLGEVRFDAEPAKSRPKPKSVSPQRIMANVPTGGDGGSAVAGSVSLLVPGFGQILSGEVAAGLFFLSGFGFCAALLWAIYASIDRIVETMSIFGIGPVPVATAAVATFAAAAMLHVAAVLHAGDGTMPDPPHPVVAGVASLILPGWGQLLTGHRTRTALFLLASWATAGAWAVVSPQASQSLSALGLALPSWARDGAGPIVLVVVPSLLWIVAIYDAVAGAIMERR